MTKSLQSAFGMIDGRTVAGFVRDAAAPERKFAIEILADNVAVALVRADQFSPALAADGIADNAHGYIHTLSERLIATSQTLSARLANLDIAVGKPIDLTALAKPDPMLAAAGAFDGIDGLAISGWVKSAPKSAMLLRAMTAGEEVAATIARTWTSHVIGGEARPVLAFRLVLPDALADGRDHDIEVSTTSGVALAGSPIRFKANKPLRLRP